MIFMEMKEISVRIRCKKKFRSCAGLIKRSRTNTISKRMALETCQTPSLHPKTVAKGAYLAFYLPITGLRTMTSSDILKRGQQEIEDKARNW